MISSIVQISFHLFIFLVVEARHLEAKDADGMILNAIMTWKN